MAGGVGSSSGGGHGDLALVFCECEVVAALVIDGKHCHWRLGDG